METMNPAVPVIKTRIFEVPLAIYRNLIFNFRLSLFISAILQDGLKFGHLRVRQVLTNLVDNLVDFSL
jgi:signal transduction histidine kinase